VTPPKRQLGLGVAAAIVIANMIGASIFTSAGFQSASLGDPWTMLSTWVVGGIYALCGAAAYAELGAMMPKAGGEYVYLREAYHPAVGFMSGWVSLTAGFSAPIAAAALTFALYLSKIVPGIGDVVAQKAVACALVCAITALHAFDTRIGGRVQAAFTAIKVLLIAGVIVAGLAVGHGDWSHLASQPSAATAGSYATALMYVTFAYSGWNAAAYIAGEIKDPQRTLPRALLLGTGIVMVLYILLNVVFLYGAGPADMAPGGKPIVDVGDLAARRLFGETAGNLITSTIALALISAVSAMVMAGPRVYAAMAADHALPAPLARFSSRGVPVNAIVTQCVLAMLFVVVGDIGALIQFVAFVLTLFAALTVGAVFVFRATGRVAPYRTFGYPVTPALFILISVGVVYLKASESPVGSLEVLVLLAAGAAVFMVTSRGKPHVPIESTD
jgi:APA family basic amino acid/polyamine antiporter